MEDFQRVQPSSSSARQRGPAHQGLPAANGDADTANRIDPGSGQSRPAFFVLLKPSANAARCLGLSL